MKKVFEAAGAWIFQGTRGITAHYSKFHILHFTFILLFFLCLTGFPLQAQTDNMSPAQRRAFIRDSLRAERLKQRKDAAAENAPKEQPAASEPVSEGVSSPAETAPAAADESIESGTPVTAPTPSAENPVSQPAPSMPVRFPPPQGLRGQPAWAKPSEDRSEAETRAGGDSRRVEKRKPRPPIELPISDTIMVKSLSLRQTEIRDVLSGLAAQYGINILLERDVTGLISINLNNIPLKKALRLIVEENGFELSVLHGAIKVTKAPPAAPAAPPEPSMEVQYRDGKLTVDIQGAPIEMVARKITDVTGKNIMVDRDAKGEVTAYYKDVEFDKALNLIVQNSGFRMRESDGVTTIYKDNWVASGTAEGSKTSGNTRVFVKDSMVSLEVNNASLQQIVSSITAQAGLNAVVYGQLQGTVTAKLEKVPITRAFQYLFRGTDFTFWLDNGVFFIGSKEMKAITNSKLLVLESVKADEIMEMIPPELIKDMKVKLVPGQNALMVMGTYEAIATLEDYISKVDLPVAQILIEALVVDFDMDKIRNYGVNLFLGSAKASRGQETIYPNFNMTLNNKDTEKLFSGIPGMRDIISLPKNFVTKIEALEKEKVLRIKSRPQIATLNGKTASITVGQTQYFLLKQETDFNQSQSTTTRTQEKFDKIQADVTLTVTPFVTGRGEITVEIVPDFSEPEGSFSSNVPPTINRRYLKSTVRLREGETIVLGGLVKEGLNSDRSQFPILGSIPVIGWLFKNVNSTRSRSQLMIFVTPHIYYGNDANVDPDKYIKDL